MGCVFMMAIFLYGIKEALKVRHLPNHANEPNWLSLRSPDESIAASDLLPVD